MGELRLFHFFWQFGSTTRCLVQMTFHLVYLIFSVWYRLHITWEFAQPGFVVTLLERLNGVDWNFSHSVHQVVSLLKPVSSHEGKYESHLVMRVKAVECVGYLWEYKNSEWCCPSMLFTWRLLQTSFDVFMKDVNPLVFTHSLKPMDFLRRRKEMKLGSSFLLQYSCNRIRELCVLHGVLWVKFWAHEGYITVR